ncbi:glycerophosphodiester phosphodiesterase family protein [Breoghania sp. JC706]|uniref:glycerophosphodiester phosphodiesterase family protein n=1 Tax=Breoghania sp. JC706 TaxID=3117732 RepID=UPI003008C342
MTMIIGHRGARNLWPENSFTGFRNLLEFPVEGVEFDVHLTKAGEVLVIHDPTLERTTDGTGRVADLAPGAHRSVTLHGSDGDTIPTLDEVLEIFATTDHEIHLELKTDADHLPYAGGLEERVLEAIDRHGVASRTVVTSFSHDVLAQLKELRPDQRRLASMHLPEAERLGLEPGLRTLLDLADIIAIEKTLLADNWATITALVPADRLGVWTPNDEDELADWLSRPLRQVTTDRPDLALKRR